MSTDETRPRDAAKEMLEDLKHLVEAIDRRVPQLERLAETAIAQEAADLRRRAVALIAALEAAATRD